MTQKETNFKNQQKKYRVYVRVLGKNKETGIKIDTTKENMYKYKEYMGNVAWIEQKKLE